MRIIVLLFLLLPFISNSQVNTAVAQQYKDLSYLREYIYTHAPTYAKSKKYDRLTYKFSDIAANRIVYEFNSGDIIKWDALENYLNKILKQVIPSELANDTLIHIYIKHDGNFDAEMQPSGQLFLNVGVLAEISDEATLAGLILHELAHYYKHHTLHKFLHNEVVGTDWGVFGSVKKPRDYFSQQQELEADSLASVWMEQTPYFHSGLLNYYRILQRLEQRKLLTLEDYWELKNSHIPPSKTRIAKYEANSNKIKQNDANLFVVSKTDFMGLKKQAKPLILDALLTNINKTNYDDCIERAFAFHIVEPENPLFTYYIMEAIRRKAYLDDIYWQQDFITYRYFDTLRVDNVRRKRPMGRHLLEFFDVNLLALNPTEGKDIKAHFYWNDAPRFTTYDEAYAYFFRLSQTQNCTECILSYALSYTTDIEKRDGYLNEYLLSPEAKYTLFAETLLAGNFSKNLLNKKLTLVTDFNAVIKEGNDFIRLDNAAADNLRNINYVLDSVRMNYPYRTIRMFSDIQAMDYLDFKKFTQLKKLFLLPHYVGNKNFSPHLLDPSFAELFLKYNVKEIEFIGINFLEYRKAEKTKEAYKYALKTSFYELANTTNTSQTLDFYLISINENILKTPTFIYSNRDISLNFKRNGFTQLAPRIKLEIDRKDGVMYQQTN
ncbi:MAG: hypothetical protein COW67_11800 [Flavobacteriales bacterium CG18_big_fil_WC_8_21_14_2_50_32_9]|nr:MAG: hypothetical protein COW67_11800 [Flavobacteriales bacterium CG18_big_fil_WC_8_21_14_2_50_32_9]